MIKRTGKSNQEHMNDLKKGIMKAMEESVVMVQSDAQLNVGVDTGRLRSSLTHDVVDKGDKIQGQVGSNVEYAPHHALHNSYLENAIDSNVEQIKRRIGDVLK